MSNKRKKIYKIGIFETKQKATQEVRDHFTQGIILIVLYRLHGIYVVGTCIGEVAKKLGETQAWKQRHVNKIANITFRELATKSADRDAIIKRIKSRYRILEVIDEEK